MAPFRWFVRSCGSIASLRPSARVLPALLLVALVAASACAADRPEDEDAYKRPWRRNAPSDAAARPKPRPSRRRAPGAPLDDQAPRRWRDAAGGVDVVAVLVAIDATGVTLKREDGTEITLPLAALAPVDRLVALRERRRAERERPDDHVGPIHDADGASRRPAPPPPEPFVPVADDPDAPGARRPPIASWRLPRAGSTAAVTAILPAGDEEDDWILVEVQDGLVDDEPATLLHWLRPGDDPTAGDSSSTLHALPDGERVLDYHPVLELLLTAGRRPTGSDAGHTADSLTLWDVSPRLERPAPVARWTATLRAGWRRPWARIVDDTAVLFVDRNRDLVCLDPWTGKTRWFTHQDSIADAPPALDATRARVLLPEDGGVRVLDASRGAEQATVSCPERVASAALSPDGRRLAIVGGGRIRVHDLASPTEAPVVIEAPSVDAVGGSVAWAGPDVVAASNQTGRGTCILYSVPTRLPLRRYVSAAAEESADATTTLVPGGILSLVPAPFQAMRTTLGTVVATRLPEPTKARGPAAALPPVVAPGTAVNVYTLCGRHDAEVRGLLMGILERHGWVYDRTSPITLAGYLFEQKPVAVTWRTPRSGLQPGTVRPTVASLRIVTPQAVLWEKSSGAFVFDRFTADDGQSAQEWIDRVLPPGPAFFRSVTIPDSIPDPRERYGTGTSVLAAGGPEPIDEP